MRKGEHKCRIMEVRLELKGQQLKNILFIYRMPYQKYHYNHKPKMYNRYTYKIQQSKHNIKDGYQNTREEKKRRGKKKTYKNRFKTINKMALRTYIS